MAVQERPSRPMTRREFLRLAGLGVAGAALAACGPHPPSSETPIITPVGSVSEEPPPSTPEGFDERFTVKVLQLLYAEIKKWEVFGGINMTSQFSTIRDAADVLSGKIDPRNYFDIIKPPLGFKITDGTEKDEPITVNTKYYEHPDLSWQMNGMYRNPEDGKSIPVEAQFVRDVSFNLGLKQETLESDIRLPLIVRGASIIRNMRDYAAKWMEDVPKELGLSIEVKNGWGLPISTDQLNFSVANLFSQYELNKLREDNSKLQISYFGRLVSMGSLIQSGVAASNFVNDYFAREMPEPRPPENEMVILKKTRDLLLGNGLQKRLPSGLIAWTDGKPPDIFSGGYMDLVDQLALNVMGSSLKESREMALQLFPGFVEELKNGTIIKAINNPNDFRFV